MNTLRFITAGNVDDGKSTLIGRLLYDSGSIHTDQLGILQQHSKLQDDIDLSLVTDGLRAEREQGITIDVAYKYFATVKRKFIIADAPGHEQYTRNMITGASNSDLVILLIDARKGITGQTKRHASIAALMGIKKAVVAVNKIDLVDYRQSVFDEIIQEFDALKEHLSFDAIHYIPVSALKGDNIVNTTNNTPWYQGPSLIALLENIELNRYESEYPRFQVQWVIRPKEDTHHDYRGYAGKVISGVYRVGDRVNIFPANITTTISGIERHQEAVDTASAGENIVLHLEDNVDISRGDSIIPVAAPILPKQSLNTWISWLDKEPLQLEKTYLLQHRFNTVRVKIMEVEQLWDVHNWAFTAAGTIKLNDIAQVNIKTNQGIVADSLAENTANGYAILIDESSKHTVAALMFL